MLELCNSCDEIASTTALKRQIRIETLSIRQQFFVISATLLSALHFTLV